MESDDELYEEEEEFDMDFSESDARKESDTSSENVPIEEHNKYGSLENIFFHVIPPAHPNSCPKVLVYLPLHTPIYFKGKLKIIRVISGAIECLGSVMTENSITGFGRNVYSPKGYSLLSFIAVSKLGNEKNSDEKHKHRKYLKNELKSVGLKKEVFQTIHKQDEASGCFFEIENLDGPSWAKVLEKYLAHSSKHKSNAASGNNIIKPISLFGRDNAFFTQHQMQGNSAKETVEQLLNINLYDNYSHTLNQKVPRLFKSNPAWDTAVTSVLKSMTSQESRKPRLVVAGGKGVGKSTFMRYVTNRLLHSISENTDSSSAHNPAVLYIDLDPGQAEFTIPGCLSVTKVVRPIMGPNFCHLESIKEYCEYFGEVNVSNMPRSYDGCVRRILGYCEEKPELNRIPWLINTMGFTSGLGAKMISTTLSICHPGVLVELRSRFVKKNYKTNLKTYLDTSHDSPCDFIQYDAIPESLSAKDMRAKSYWGIPEPKKLRDISILAYFGQCCPSLGNENISRNLLQAVTPYVVSWDDVAVQVLHTTISSFSIPKLFNMSLVGLGQIQTRDIDQTSMKHREPGSVTMNKDQRRPNISLNPSAPEFVPGAATGKQIAEKDIHVPVSTNDDITNTSKENKNEPLRPPKLLNQKEICRNVGFGFVRGVDTEKRLFYVVTPVPIEEMNVVNCLTMGAVTLPTGIIGNQVNQMSVGKNRKALKGNRKQMNLASSFKNRNYKEKDVPYLAIKQEITSSNQGLYSTPFSAPWQRYSKPKFQEPSENADLSNNW